MKTKKNQPPFFRSLFTKCARIKYATCTRTKGRRKKKFLDIFTEFAKETRILHMERDLECKWNEKDSDSRNNIYPSKTSSVDSWIP